MSTGGARPRFPETNVAGVSSSRFATSCGDGVHDWSSGRPRPAPICWCSMPPGTKESSTRGACPSTASLRRDVGLRTERLVERFNTLVRPSDVEVLDEDEDEDMYHRTNLALLERAAALAESGEEIVALVVRPPQQGDPSVSDHLAAAALPLATT